MSTSREYFQTPPAPPPAQETVCAHLDVTLGTRDLICSDCGAKVKEPFLRHVVPPSETGSFIALTGQRQQAARRVNRSDWWAGIDADPKWIEAQQDQGWPDQDNVDPQSFK